VCVCVCIWQINKTAARSTTLAGEVKGLRCRRPPADRTRTAATRTAHPHHHLQLQLHTACTAQVPHCCCCWVLIFVLIGIRFSDSESCAQGEISATNLST